MTLPSGTVTFLFTDIEGSTRMWEDIPDTMRTALARHNDLLSAAITDSGGHVFKTIGDAYCAAFSRAEDAAKAAAVAQLAILAEPWPDGAVIRVRMGIHTGAAMPEGNDYFGPALNRVARLLALGHGGQTLLSESSQQLCSDALPANCTLKPMGEHRLKDIRRSESVFQLCHVDLPTEFAPLKSVGGTATPNNLPEQSTSFVGRDKEMVEVTDLVASSRLVCLTGPGGGGKTRLALQIAAGLLADYPDGVWFVELAPVTDPVLVPAAIASCLSIGEEPGVPLDRSLTNSLKLKKMLILLDNCEHVVAAAARSAGAILREECAGIRMIATSREHLNIAGEQTYRVHSLATPGRRELRSGHSPSEYGAVQLFADRARASDPKFQVTEQNSAAVVQVCERLDGIPLAIELASARVRFMPVSQIAARLDDRFALLTRGSRTALPHQQTLRALVDWSWELLGPQEQVLLRRVAIFADGFTLDAAEAVCAELQTGSTDDEIDASEVLDLLFQLVDKSMVSTDTRSDWPRYRLLETVREYAHEKLKAADEVAALADRHFAWALNLATEANKGLTGPEMLDWLDHLEMDHANLRLALQCRTSVEDTLQLAVLMMQFWFVRGYLTEARELLTGALNAAPDCDAKLRAGALNQLGIVAWRQGDFSEAERYLSESLEIRRALEDTGGEAAALNNLGMLMDEREEYAAARLNYELAAAIYRNSDDRARLGMVLSNLGSSLLGLGELDPAEVAFGEFLELARETGNPWSTATAQHNLGEIALQQGDYKTALAFLKESISVLADLGDTQQVLQVLLACARAVIDLGYAEFGVELLAAVQTIETAEDVKLPEKERAELVDTLKLASSTVETSAFDLLWEQGQQLDLGKAAQAVVSWQPSRH